MKPQITKKVITFTALTAIVIVGAADLFARGWNRNGNPETCPRYTQGEQLQRGQRGGNMNYLVEELKLSEAQVNKIFDINNDFRKQMFKLRENNASREEMGKLADNRQKAVEKVFTADQLKRYQELADNRQSRGQKRR